MRRGVKNSPKMRDVIYGRPLILHVISQAKFVQFPFWHKDITTSFNKFNVLEFT